MRQSRLMSLVEAVANVVVGFGVAVVTQLLVFPLFGIEADLGRPRHRDQLRLSPPASCPAAALRASLTALPHVWLSSRRRRAPGL